MFKVGQKVVYVHHKIVDHKFGNTTPDPNVIYTVRAIGVIGGVISAILLQEIRNAPRLWCDAVYELHMNSAFFRPLVENKSEISFTTGADPESEKWDNRVSRTVRA